MFSNTQKNIRNSKFLSGKLTDPVTKKFIGKVRLKDLYYKAITKREVFTDKETLLAREMNGSIIRTQYNKKNLKRFHH